MKIVSSYKVKIMDFSKIFNDTIEIYRNAVAFFIEVCSKEWDSISLISWNQAKQRFVETITLATAKNPSPKYDFNGCFYKMPCYLRRAAISAAIGAYSSYSSNFQNWKDENPKTRGNQPTLQLDRYVMPVLYKKGMFIRTDSCSARIKAFHKNDWVWIDVRLNKQDVKYIENHCSDLKECSPSLMKKGKRWYLVFPFEESVKLNDTKLEERIVCGVDLGLNNDAVCSIMRSDGTVVARKFINFPTEKDHLYKSLNRVRKAQQYGSKKVRNKWKHVNDLNTDLCIKISKFIMDFAVLHNTDVIVFEHLDMKGKKPGKHKMRLHVWRKNCIQERVTHMAHRKGIRISRICARNTSRLAYDGSGVVERGHYIQNGKKCLNYSICVFKNGKVYNCDLNASYNIASRYFIREFLKSEEVLNILQVLPAETKDFRYGTGTTRTLSHLIKLHADMLSLVS